MEQQELLAIISGFAVFLLLCAIGASTYIFRTYIEDDSKTVPAQVPRVPRGAGRLAAGARRRRVQAATAAAAEDEDGENEADNDHGDGGGARQPQRAEAESKYSRKDAYEEKRRKRDEAREAQQLAEEQDAARKEAERQAAQDAEAAEWMGQISVEKEGTGASEEVEQQGLLQAFVEYIKERKTVVLEDLAADFSLRVQDVISRLQSLESMGRITGVMDDRGKFIYISREEMEVVADFIQQRGRVAISELAARSNTFIDLEAKAAAAPPDMAAVLGLDFDEDGEQDSAASQ